MLSSDKEIVSEYDTFVFATENKPKKSDDVPNNGGGIWDIDIWGCEWES